MKQEPKFAKIHFDDTEPTTEHKSPKAKLRLVDKAYKAELKQYEAFHKIDGTHQWQKQVPEGFLGYQARVIKNSKVTYFNFDLAKEMGLIPKNHEHKMNDILAENIKDCFSLQIINEFDIQHKRVFPKNEIKPNLYMATRYLQLQHSNKQGKTSGDGRSIWNGQITHKGITWDVSSRGTGATALSPGAVEADQFLETGQEKYGYGCGLAETDELYGTAIMSEIFHLNSIPTERSLAILETSTGVGIGVRAAPNLIRPAHLFSYLKQNNLDALKRATDYFIDRQFQNKKFAFHSKQKNSYRKMLKQIVEQYAEFAARLESDYIFAWFDWDGDNMLMDVGILDYGSIRQFGLRHDEYRYDDVTRYSTNLNEQKTKTKEIVKVFCQLVDYLETGKKRAINSFDNSIEMQDFESHYNRCTYKLFLNKLGFSESQAKQIYKKHSYKVKKLFDAFSLIEKAKTTNKIQDVDDGINKPPLYNPRTLLRYSLHWFEGQSFDPMESHRFCLAEHCKFTHLNMSSKYKSAFTDFHSRYLEFVKLAKHSMKINAAKFKENCIKQNHPDRITGNSITYIVDELLTRYKSNKNKEGIQNFIDLFIYNEVKKTNDKVKMPKHAKVPKDLMKDVLYIVKEHNEDI